MPLVYDPASISAYWGKRPRAVATRIVQLLSVAGGFLSRIAGDVINKKVKEVILQCLKGLKWLTCILKMVVDVAFFFFLCLNYDCCVMLVPMLWRNFFYIFRAFFLLWRVLFLASKKGLKLFFVFLMNFRNYYKFFKHIFLIKIICYFFKKKKTN